MKKILILALLSIFLLASYSSAQIVSAKNLPEDAKNAVIKANSVVNAIRMNPEIPFEEHAFLITTNTTYVVGVPPGKIVVLPPGNQVIQLGSQTYTGKVFLDFTFEPGNYYSIELANVSYRKFKPNLVVLANEERLELAKQEVAKIKENLEACFEYLEYSKHHPNALDGTYKYGLGKMIIKDNRLSWVKDIKNMKIKYDGETIILLGNVKNKADPLILYIWYYRFRDDGKLEIMPNITEGALEGLGFFNVFAYKSVP